MNNQELLPIEKSYAIPDMHRELDIGSWLRQTPATHRVKGMFASALVQAVQQARPGYVAGAKYLAFKDYPLRDYLEVMAKAAKALYPHIPLREGLRRVGWLAFPTLAESIAGRVLFSVAGRDWAAALGLVSKAYALSLTPGSATLAEMRSDRAVVVLRDVWAFVDSYQVGVFEGAMRHYDVEGAVRVNVISHCDAELEITWS